MLYSIKTPGLDEIDLLIGLLMHCPNIYPFLPLKLITSFPLLSWDIETLGFQHGNPSLPAKISTPDRPIPLPRARNIFPAPSSNHLGLFL
jgi:hypothetical protein